MISTKADTLRALRPHLTQSRIERGLVFRVYDWKINAEEVLDQVEHALQSLVVVRSSAANEDTLQASMAGCYTSVLDIDATEHTQIREAIESVIRSYGERGSDRELNQVLVQEQTTDVAVSGVVFTHHNITGAPYYVINYDDRSGRTDTVTHGHSSQLVEIARSCPLGACPLRWRRLLAAVREIEEKIPNVALDIEFAITAPQDVVIFQVRPLTAVRPWGCETPSGFCRMMQQARRTFRQRVQQQAKAGQPDIVLSNMAFWNPAELIGVHPKPLARSLFAYLIADSAWNRALAPLGYTSLTHPRLMIDLAGQPFIDVAKAFAALIPATVTGPLRHALLTHYLALLRECPELHDKVEFAIIDSCMVCGWRERQRRLQAWGPSAPDIAQFASALRALTQRILTNAPTIMAQDFQLLAQLRQLATPSRSPTQPPRSHDAQSVLASACARLQQARRFGTIPFSRLARMAFIGKAFLQSLVTCGGLIQEEAERFLHTLETVASAFRTDAQQLAQGQLTLTAFLQAYGHLRPGTYDITAPRYDQEPERLIAGGRLPPRAHQSWSPVFGAVHTPPHRSRVGDDWPVPSPRVLIVVRQTVTRSPGAGEIRVHPVCQRRA